MANGRCGRGERKGFILTVLLSQLACEKLVLAKFLWYASYTAQKNGENSTEDGVNGQSKGGFSSSTKARTFTSLFVREEREEKMKKG